MGKTLRKSILYVTITVIVIYSVFPLYWALVSSLRPSDLLFKPELRLLPGPLTFTHYRTIFLESGFGRNLFNSAVVSAGTMIIALLIGSIAAYSLGRLPLKGKNTILYLVLSMTMFPQISILSGLFVLLRSLHIFNSYAGLIFSYLLFTLPFTVWVMTQYFRALPSELEEAAYMDGASPLSTYWRVLLPLTTPGLVTTGILSFIAAWNEFLFALTFTVGNKVRTVPVAIAFFGGASPYEIPWGSIMAASVVVTLPLILLVFFFQHRIVAGLTAGALK